MLHQTSISGAVMALAMTAAASPLFNTTIPGQFSNQTTTVTEQRTSTLYQNPGAGSAVAGAVFADQLPPPGGPVNPVDPSASTPTSTTTMVKNVQVAVPTSTSTIVNTVQVSPVSQAPSLASFQTVVVTETVAGCTLGASAGPALATASPFSGQAPFAVAAASSTSAGTYAAATLLPAVHWEYPVDDIQNLAPSNSSELYFSAGGVSDPSVQHLFASLSSTFSYDSVVLDHSSYVSSTTCSEDGILVTFTDVEAFTFASQSWSASTSGFVLVTYTDGCHGDTNEQRTFWLVDKLQFINSTLSIQAVVAEELAVENALAGVDMVWGTYHPPSNSTGNSASVGGASSGSGSSSTTTSGSGSSSATTSGSSSGSGLAASTNNSTSSSNSTANGSACGAAPASTIDGLPAVACGDENFDLDLDNLIGYLDFSSADYASSIEDFAPGISFGAEALADDGTAATRRSLQLGKRSFFWGGPAAIVKAVVHVTVAVVTAPVQIAVAAIKTIPVVAQFVAAKTEFDPAISGQQDFNFGPDASADSPWGKAAQIYSKTKTSSTDSSNTADISIYCVDCGIKGHVALTGTAKWNLIDGLHALNAAINANLAAGINIGLVAHAAYSDTKSKQLVNVPLPGVGVSVPKVFAAGVFVSVDAVSVVSVTAEGQALVGVTMTVPNFQANLNLFDQNGASGSSVTGFTPTFEKRFEASGSVSASLRLSLPIAINVGVEVMPLSLKRTIALIEEPSIYGNLTAAGSTSNVAAASETCNNGIEYFANLQNDVKFDFLGLKTFTLNHYDSPPLLQGCKQFGSSSNASSSAVSSSATSSEIATSADGDSTSATSATDSATPTDTSATATDASATATDASATVTDAPVTENVASATATDDSSTVTNNENAIVTTTGSTSNPTSAAAALAAAAAAAVTSDTDSTATSATATAISSEVAKHRRFSLMARQDNSTTSSTTASGDTVISNDETDSFDSDASDTSDQTDDAVDDDSSDANNSEFTEDASKALDEATAESGEDGFTFTTVVDVQKTFALAPGTNGNLLAAAVDGTNNGSALFATYQNVIIGDDGERILHYYPDEMAVYNASRIRLSYEDQTPKTADVITLSAIDYDSSDSSNPSVYFAVDSKSNVYSLVLCDFSNGADSKVFVVNGESGIESLTKNGNMRFTVTGAPVSACYGLALVAGVSSNSTSSS